MEGPLPEFPLFAEMFREVTLDDGTTDLVPYFICLFKKVNDAMFCARNLENFSEVLTDLCQDHQLPLNPRLDFLRPLWDYLLQQIGGFGTCFLSSHSCL